MRKNVFPLLIFVLLLGLASCEKTGALDYEKMQHPTADTAGDINSVLNKSPLTLFKQAAQRIRLDTLLQAASYFTVFAPVDSAMQAAGLDAGTINSLPIDSLKKLVLYHIVSGAYSDGSLTAALTSVEAHTLRQDISYDRATANANVYQQELFFKKTGLLYVNGEPVTGANDTAFTATNGYIWPIRSFLQAPTQNIWQILQSRPELSMYLMACRIDDSIYEAYGMLNQPYANNQVAGDSTSFTWMVYDNQPNSYFYGRARPTVFAPTNAAFEAAGFHTYDDLATYAGLSEPGLGFDANFNAILYSTPLDSVLKTHLILSPMNKFTNMSLYNDLSYNPDINNGVFNQLLFWQTGFYQSMTPIPTPALQFSGSQGAVSIKWSTSLPADVLPADRSRHIMTMNGVIYEMDQLFYPHN
jgi:uncharacterized surface protein with fasciclin (FAS1) repeats